MKKEAKHTPGPILKEGETPLGVMLLAGPEDRETIIYLHGPERHQCARLFTAAPELLRALIFLVNAHEHPAASSGRRGVLEYVPVALDHARAAIARATGQEASND
jgi:hypothetical protein